MRGPNRWWILLLAIVLAAVSGCTENNLDDSEASVILEILSVNDPPVTGDSGGAGTCSGDGTTPCLDSTDCALNQLGICEFPLADCVVADWNVSVANKPLNSQGMESPFNDIVVHSVAITYRNQDGSLYVAETRTVPIGQTIPANGTGSFNFAPISFDDITVDNTTVNLQLSFAAQTVSGEAVNIAGGTGRQLFIENCLP